MEVAITGASGLVGGALSRALGEAGYTTKAMVRRPARGENEIAWQPGVSIDREKLQDVDAIVHLGGRSIAALRWTAGVKREIYDSRVGSTRFLAETLADMNAPPRVLVCASAVGFYGNRGEQLCDESMGPGQGFLAEVCRDWEAAAAPANAVGVRVVHLRFGLILSADGGPLPKMVTPFRLGLGGPFGNGRQYMPWVTIEDVVRAIEFSIVNQDAVGPLNCTAPQQTSNAEFTRALGRVLHRPTPFAVPAFALRLGGQMTDELFLSGQRVSCDRIQALGFSFQQPQLEPALSAILRA